VRYFRIVPEVYEATRTHLDSVFGHPTADGRTITCVPPLAVAARDVDGRVLLSVWPEFVAIPAVTDVLPSLIESGAVEELSESEFLAASPAWPL
jgi:hypothetical protein